MNKIFVIVAIALLLPFSSWGGVYDYFESFNSCDGLPHNSVTTSLQDNYGFLWFGTKGGLCRYDGEKFVRIHGNDLMSSMAFDLALAPDGKIWYSTVNGVGSFNPDTDEAFALGLIDEGAPMNIEVDADGNVWMLRSGLWQFDPSAGSLQKIQVGSSSVSGLVADSRGGLWVAGRDSYLYKYDNQRGEFAAFRPDIAGNVSISSLYRVLNSKIIAVTSDRSFYVVDTKNMSARLLCTKADLLGANSVWAVSERVPGEYWIGTDKGLLILADQGKSFSITPVVNNRTTARSFPNDSATSLIFDRDGNAWIGTIFNGLQRWLSNRESFKFYMNEKGPNTFSGLIVRTIAQDQNGIIWAGCEDGELNRIDPLKGKIDRIEAFQRVNIQDILADGDNLWVCGYRDGVYLFDIPKMSILKHFDKGLGTCVCILKTKEKDILVGTRAGLFRYDRALDSFVTFGETMSRQFIHCLFQDHLGRIWVGTYGKGVSVLDSDGELLSKYAREDKTSNIGSNYITSITEDSHNRIWITTEGGGARWADISAGIGELCFSRIGMAEGLSSDICSSIVEDKSGELWLATSKGLVLLSSDDLQIVRRFFETAVVLSPQFSYGASCIADNGSIYMGTINGLLCFKPSLMKTDLEKSNFYITDIEAISKEKTIHLKEEGKSCLMSQTVSVPYDEISSLKISFSTPEFTKQGGLRYLCTLKRGNQIVSSVEQGNSVEYTALHWGKMEFEVSLLQSSRVKPLSRKLTINVTPPLRYSKAAFVLYAVLGLLVIGTIIFLIVKQIRSGRKTQMDKIQVDKEKEIYNAKIDFFTNITHEIRTPLTLIKMPLDKLIKAGAFDSSARNDVMTIKDNTDRLLELTNQLLDINRIEQDEMDLIFSDENICTLVLSTCDYFERLSMDRHVAVTYDIPKENILINCCRDSIRKIVSNLMSNALKYGKDKIALSLEQNGDKIFIRVNSNGERIPQDDAERIFEKFFTAGKGTGLGLAYARSLAEKHGGALYLDNSVLDMNSFVLELPFKREQKPAQIEDSREEEFEQHLLLVEDSVELRDYLATELSSQYKVSVAANGVDALEVLKTRKIDLVISDILMPEMDGCQLCNHIKNDFEFSHIPVILMTAVVGMDTRMETLQVAADSYIEKPFPIELLRATITSLFKNREISYRQFSSSPLSHFSGPKTSKLDEDYMDRLHETIMQHLDEQDFGIESLTVLLNTSKSTLYRKVKANMGLNINEYIKVCRLKKAAEMLSSQKYRINEVSYLVGFSSPSYFATCFLNQFNQTPSAFVKGLLEEEE